MDKVTYQVTYNGKVKDFRAGTCFGEIVSELAPNEQEDVMLVSSDNYLMELHKGIEKDCSICMVRTSDKIGNDTYRRSVSMLLMKAIGQAAEAGAIEKIILQYSVPSGYYYVIRGDVTVDTDFLAKVKKIMLELVDRKCPIRKRNVSRNEALELFHERRMYDKEQLFRYRRGSRVNIYELDGYEDYHYGFMTWHTGYLKYFDLVPYDEGFVLLLPTAESPREIPVLKPMPKIFQVQKEAERWGEMIGLDTVGALNEQISGGDIQKMILISEALQEGKISWIAEEIAKKKDVRFVMIAGPSSSGKTTFSHRLSIQLAVHGLHPYPIAVDNYFVNRDDTPIDENGMRDYECLEAMDIERFNEDMTALMNGECVSMPTYNFLTGKREYKGNTLQLKENDILVIEGIHCLNDALSYSLPREKKFKIYLSALTQLNIDEHNRIPTTDGRLLRRIVRDNRTRGNSARETIGRWSSVRRGEEKYIFPFQEEADVMFNSALIYELAVLKQYVEPLLFQIPMEAPEYPEANRLLKFLEYFISIPCENIPFQSILREFIGGSCFDV